MINVNLALTGIILFLAYAIIRTYIREQRARKTDIDFACGFIGRDITGMTPAERQEEILRLREESRQYMDSRGYHFDYSSADAENEERQRLREEEREETLIRFLAECAEEERRHAQQAEVISIEDLQRRQEPDMPKESRPQRERGIAVLYPRSKNVPRPPKPRTRRRVKKRDGSSTYQLGQTISPVYGVQSQPVDKSIQNFYINPADRESIRVRREKRELERQRRHEEKHDDAPVNLEAAYNLHRDKTHARLEEKRKEQAKAEILARDISVKEYLENIRAVDEYRKRMARAI